MRHHLPPLEHRIIVTDMKSLTRLLPTLALCWLLLPLPSLAASGSYVMEMVIFEQPGGHNEIVAGERPQANSVAGSLNSGGPGVRPLPARGGRLGPAVYTLNRKGARVLARLRWVHNFGARGSSGWMRVSGNGIRGAVRLRKGRFIHVFTDLKTNDSNLPIREHGRLRSGELHYIDHPRIGILVRADRVGQPKPEASKPSDQTEETAPPSPTKDDNPPEEREPAGEIPRALPDNS